MANSAVLDTHVWVWWLTEPSRLSKKQCRYLESSDAPLFLSQISVWEVAKLVEKDRLRFSMAIDQWLEQAVEMPRLNLVSLELPIILASTRISFPGDPADQLVIATARHLNVQLLTADREIAKSKLVRVIE